VQGWCRIQSLCTFQLIMERGSTFCTCCPIKVNALDRKPTGGILLLTLIKERLSQADSRETQSYLKQVTITVQGPISLRKVATYNVYLLESQFNLCEINAQNSALHSQVAWLRPQTNAENINELRREG